MLVGSNAIFWILIEAVVAVGDEELVAEPELVVALAVFMVFVVLLVVVVVAEFSLALVWCCS